VVTSVAGGGWEGGGWLVMVKSSDKWCGVVRGDQW